MNSLSSYLDINWIYFVISNNSSSPSRCVWAPNFTVSFDLLQLQEHLRCRLIPTRVLFFHFSSHWKNKKDYFLTLQPQFSSWVNFRCFFRWKCQRMACVQRVKGHVMPVLCFQLFPVLLWRWVHKCRSTFKPVFIRKVLPRVECWQKDHWSSRLTYFLQSLFSVDTLQHCKTHTQESNSESLQKWGSFRAVTHLLRSFCSE